MNVRVTSQTQTANAIALIQQRSIERAKYQDQIASSLRITRPSDDPAAFPALSRAKAASLRMDAYAQTVNDSTALLNSSVSALQEVNDVLVRAKQLALEGADATTSANPTSLEALAVEVDGLIDRALRAANSQPDGKSLFGGTAIDTPPFRVTATDPQGRPMAFAYDGAAERARVLTGPNQTVETRYVGSEVFQKPGADVFQALVALRDALRDPALTGAARVTAFQQRLTELDAARDAVGDAIAEQSSTLATLEAVGNLTRELKLTADTRIGELEGADYAEAIIKLQEHDAALQAISATIPRIFQTGLLEFLR